MNVELLRARLSGVDSVRWQISVQRSGDALQEIVANLSVGQPLDWWVTSPASRNPFVSRLYRSMCIIDYVAASLPHWQHLAPPSLVVDSTVLATVLETMLRSHGLHRAKVVVVGSGRVRRVISALRHSLGHIIRLAVVRYPRKLGHANRASPSIVDLFVLKGWRGGDRYYGDMLQMLSEAEASSILLVPEFLSASPLELLKQKRLLRCGRAGVLFKESLLSIGDYVFALFHAFRVRRLALPDVEYCGVNITGLVREEIGSLDGFDQAVRGLLNYRFFMRLKRHAFHPRRIIDWFENQALDKGWNFGANTFFPESDTVGYQPFADVPSYFCMFPTRYEHEAKVLPRTLALMGDGFRITRTRYFPEMRTCVAPAFRFAYLWRQRHASGLDKFVVLVTLPIDHTVGARMLQAAISKLSGYSLGGKAVELRIKPHPAGSRRENYGVLGGDVAWEERPFDLAIDEATILLSTMSNTCLEAIVRNVPVLVFADKSGAFNTIPSDVPEKWWQACSTGEEILEAVKLCVSEKAIPTRHDKEVDAIRKSYYEPVTVAGARAFLGLDNGQSTSRCWEG